MKKCVFYELDENYKSACLVSVKSLLNNNDIDVFVYCINFVDYDFENKLKEISKNINVVFYKLKTDLKCYGIFSKIIDTISAKFYIFNELLEKYESVLFLDCDVLIRKNILEIFENKNGIFACNDTLRNLFLTKYRKDFFRKFKFNSKKYINAGFVLVNNFKFDLNDYREKIKKHGFYYPEQDYLNLLDHTILDLKYCGNYYCENNMLKIDFYSFHYYGRKKPFNFFSYDEIYDMEIKYMKEYYNITKSIEHLLDEKFISNVERNFKLNSN